MPEADLHDDSVRRYVVVLNAYRAERRERGAWPVVAFDNEAEFLDYLRRHEAQLRERQARGLADERDHYSGTIKEAGADQANRVRRWRERGAHVKPL